jgi:sigma-B regulation protein RsbQ
MVFLHGFGCDQTTWRYVVPHFEADHRIVLLDLVGAGGSDLSAYDRDRYGTLDAHAEDLLEICRALDLRDAVLVGHSVSAMIAVIAANREPEGVGAVVMVCPSPRYVDDEGYRGGFAPADIDELLATMDDNYLGWASATAPAIMGVPDRPELGDELTNAFCRTDPEIARHFARVTFLSDNRDDLPAVRVPALVLQCTNDLIAPVEVGEYVRDRIPSSRLVMLEATGHCPNLSAPAQTAGAIRDFLQS